MFIQFVLGSILIGLTVIVHAFALDILFKLTDHFHPWLRGKLHRFRKAIILIVVVLGVFLANIVEIWMWTVLYLFLDSQELQTFESALYFSTVTFTTVGYGDIVLGENWRLLSSFQSANGMILFGWSTAFIFEIMSRLYKQDKLKP